MGVLLNSHPLVPFNKVGDGLEIIHDANEVNDDTLEDNKKDRNLIFNHLFQLSTNCQWVRLSDKDKDNVDEVFNTIDENSIANDQKCLVLNVGVGREILVLISRISSQ